MDAKNADELSKELMTVIKDLGEKYATDENGVFNLQDYIAFQNGLRAGLSLSEQIWKAVLDINTPQK